MRENNTVSSPVQFQQDASTISNVLHAALNETPNNSSRREDLNLRIEDLHQHTSSATILDVKAMLAQHDQELKEKNSREQTEQDTRRRELAGSENEFIIRPLDSWHMTATEGNKLYATSKRSQDESPMDAMLEKEIQEILNKKQGRVLADGTVKTAEEYLSPEDQKRLQNIRESLARTAATTGDPELFNKTLTPQKNGFFRNVLKKGGSARAEDGKTLRRDIPVVPDNVVVNQELRIDNAVGKRAKRITGGPELDELKAKNDAINAARIEAGEQEKKAKVSFEEKLQQGRENLPIRPEQQNIGFEIKELRNLLDSYPNNVNEANDDDANELVKKMIDKQNEIIALWVEHENSRRLEMFVNHSDLPIEIKTAITATSQAIVQNGEYNHESLLKLSQLLLEHIHNPGINQYIGDLFNFIQEVGLGGILTRTIGTTKGECDNSKDLYYTDQKNVPPEAGVLKVDQIGFVPTIFAQIERDINKKPMKVIFDVPDDTYPNEPPNNPPIGPEEPPRQPPVTDAPVQTNDSETSQALSELALSITSEQIESEQSFDNLAELASKMRVAYTEFRNNDSTDNDINFEEFNNKYREIQKRMLEIWLTQNEDLFRKISHIQHEDEQFYLDAMIPNFRNHPLIEMIHELFQAERKARFEKKHADTLNHYSKELRKGAEQIHGGKVVGHEDLKNKTQMQLDEEGVEYIVMNNDATFVGEPKVVDTYSAGFMPDNPLVKMIKPKVRLAPVVGTYYSPGFSNN